MGTQKRFDRPSCQRIARPKQTSARPGDTAAYTISSWRYCTLLVVLLCLGLLALAHVAGLQVVPDVDKGFHFLQRQGDNRTIRRVEIPAYRGVITDRNGEPLAVSTPVMAICADPKRFDWQDEENLGKLAASLHLRLDALKKTIAGYRNKKSKDMYLAKDLTPLQAKRVLALKIPGIYKRQEFKRFYPAGEVAAQLVGLTGSDGHGQEGMEKAFDDLLYGFPGKKKVLKDKNGQVIKELNLEKSEKAGGNLVLSIDLRLQYAAYRELKIAMQQFQAKSGSVVVLDVKTGEVLAMVNQPSYNPNNRRHIEFSALRNRAVTDLIEPGSVMKPLTMVAALESGQFSPTTVIDTSPGHIRVGKKTISDHRNYGHLNVGGILAKSSQVGTTKIALQLEPEEIRDVFSRVGLGESLGTGFPGERVGVLPSKRRWQPIERAAMAFGYGISVTPLQLARAYAVLANDGIKRPVSLLKLDTDHDALIGEERVFNSSIGADVREMMQRVVAKGGTGTRAAISTYQVAGKTGTSHKVGAQGYQKDHYVGLFAGMAPADNPRFVTVVVIDDPGGEAYYGGLVAAPVFSKVTSSALRLMSVPPTGASAAQVVKNTQAVKSILRKSDGGAT